MEKFIKAVLVITVIANSLSIIGLTRKLERCIAVPDGYRVEARIVSDDWPTYISNPDKTFAVYFIKE